MRDVALAQVVAKLRVLRHQVADVREPIELPVAGEEDKQLVFRAKVPGDVFPELAQDVALCGVLEQFRAEAIGLRQRLGDLPRVAERALERCPVLVVVDCEALR